jgi:Glycosyltransferase family 87
MIGSAHPGDRSGSPVRWRPSSPGFRLWAGILLALCCAYSVSYLVTAGHRIATEPPGDSVALWTWARFILAHPAAEIYQPALLHAGQVALGLAPGEYYPFAYPPSFLLLLRPMGLLDWKTAYWSLLALSLPLYLWATVGKSWRSPTTFAALVAPTTTISIVSGQTGFLAAALLIGGFRLIGRYPLLGGTLFGLLTYKPQLGLLVPIALVSSGSWRSVAAAGATFVTLVAISSIAFGPHIWTAWLCALPDFSRQVSAGDARLLHFMPTVRAGLMQIGAPATVALLAQGIATVVAAGIVWTSFRSGPTPLAVASLFVAVFFATPYAFVYDMPIVATAVFWVVIERNREQGSFGLGELLLLTIAAVSPVVGPAQTHGPPVELLSLILLLGMIRRARRARHDQPQPASQPG